MGSIIIFMGKQNETNQLKGTIPIFLLGMELAVLKKSHRFQDIYHVIKIFTMFQSEILYDFFQL